MGSHAFSSPGQHIVLARHVISLSQQGKTVWCMTSSRSLQSAKGREVIWKSKQASGLASATQTFVEAPISSQNVCPILYKMVQREEGRKAGKKEDNEWDEGMPQPPPDYPLSHFIVSQFLLDPFQQQSDPSSWSLFRGYKHNDDSKYVLSFPIMPHCVFRDDTSWVGK